MSLTLSSLQAYDALFIAVQRSLDFVQSTQPPSPIARVRGTLRNALATLQVLEGHLASREPKAGDLNDISWIGRTLELLLEDKWVTDGLGAASLTWEGDSVAEAAGITVPAKPVSFEAAIKMLIDGIAVLKAEA